MPNERRYSNELNLESVGINLPYNMQAEQSVLGAVLLKPDTLTDLVEIIKPEMFYTRQNAQIWTEMLRLFTNDQTIDFVTLLDAVVSDGVFPSADEAKIYLTGLAETVPSISNVKAYAQIVQEKYLVRQLMGVAKDILQDAGDEPDADLLLENAEQRIYEIRSGRDSSALTPLSSSMVETLTNLQKISGPDADKYKGIPTGFRLLDTVLTGLGRGDLVILAAFDDDDDDEYDDSFLYHSSDNSNANVAESEKTPEAPVMESEEIPDKAVKEAAATKEEYKPEPVVEAEPIQEAAPVVEEPILEKQDEPTLVDEEPAQIVVDTPVEEEQPEEEVKPVEEVEPASKIIILGRIYK